MTRNTWESSGCWLALISTLACSHPPEPERSREALEAPQFGTNLCSGDAEEDAPLALSWPGIATLADSVLPLVHLPSVQVATAIETVESWKLQARVTEGGEAFVLDLGTVTLTARSKAEIRIPLPGELATHLRRAEYSAQLSVAGQMERRPSHGWYLSPPLYLHVDPAGRLVVYDEQGLIARHRAGDLRDRHYTRLPKEKRARVRGIAAASVQRVAAENSNPSRP